MLSLLQWHTRLLDNQVCTIKPDAKVNFKVDKFWWLHNLSLRILIAQDQAANLGTLIYFHLRCGLNTEHVHKSRLNHNADSLALGCSKQTNHMQEQQGC